MCARGIGLTRETKKCENLLVSVMVSLVSKYPSIVSTKRPESDAHKTKSFVDVTEIYSVPHEIRRFTVIAKELSFLHMFKLEEKKMWIEFFILKLFVVLNRILSNFQSFTCSTIAMGYQTLSFKVVLENKNSSTSPFFKV